MGVYIKGMEMPKNCIDCYLIDYCMNNGMKSPEEFREVRSVHCPAIDVTDNEVVIPEKDFKVYSRAMLVALSLKDLLLSLNKFEEVPNAIKSEGIAPTVNEAEEET